MTADANQTTPEADLRFHASRQKYAGEMIARCLVSDFVRYAYGRDQLPDYQAIQADAYRRMTEAWEALAHGR